MLPTVLCIAAVYKPVLSTTFRTSTTATACGAQRPVARTTEQQRRSSGALSAESVELRYKVLNGVCCELQCQGATFSPRAANILA